jgi:tetratricopeptide (TPR) repeat protein
MIGSSTVVPHRSRVGRVTLSLVFLALSAAPRRAAAQQASSAPSEESEVEQRRAEAKAKYEEGVEAYAAGRYSEAVKAFLLADHIAPSAALSFNIARAEEKLGDTAGTLRWYRDYLRRSPTAPNGAAVRDSVTALAHALAKTGVQQLTVLTAPEGARVQIDSQPPVATPWTGELAPGRHHLVFSRSGYADAQRDIDLAANEPLDVNVELVQPSAVTTSTPETPGSAPAAPAKETPREHRFGVLPWVSLGIGGAALGGALTLELMRRSAESDANHASQIDYQRQLDREQSRQTASRVFLGVGGAFVVAGGVMLLLDVKPKSHFAGAGLMCLPQSCAASALGKF